MRILFPVLIILSFLLLIFNLFFIVHDEENCGCFEWKDGNAVIINNYVSIQLMVDDTGNNYIMYKPNIEYEYIVNSVKYEGKNISQYKTLNKEKYIVEEYLENYYIGEIINIKYDKDYPEYSYMINEDESKYRLLLFIISILLCLIGTSGLIIRKNIIKTRNNKIRHCT